MLKFVVSFFIIAVLPKLCESAVAIYPPEDKPPEFANEEGCYLKELNRVIGYGETFYDVGNQCASYECESSGYTYEYTCGAVAAGPGCAVILGDLTLEYPDCCPTVVCDTRPPYNTIIPVDPKVTS